MATAKLTGRVHTVAIVRVSLRFAPLSSNGDEVRGAIVMMEADDG